MSTTPVSNSSSNSNYWVNPTVTDPGSTTGGNDLGNFDSFLKLMQAELQYQDPTSPVSSTDYVSQMSQLNSLQQLQNIASGVDAFKAYSLIGKEVTYQGTDTSGATTAQNGVVQSVVSLNGATYLNVNGANVDINSVVAVTAPPAAANA